MKKKPMKKKKGKKMFARLFGLLAPAILWPALALATAANPSNAVNGPAAITNPLPPTVIDGGLLVNGSIVQNALGAPAAPTITQSGAAGSTSMTYYCVAQDVNGNESAASASGSTTTANATLSATNFNNVVCGGVRGATSYRVLKTDTAHSLGTCQAGYYGGFCTVVDNSTGAGSAYTVKAIDQTNNLTGGNQTTTATINAQGSQASAVTCNLALSPICSWTATGNVTVTVSNPVAGTLYYLVETQDATGGRTATLAGATFTLPNGGSVGTNQFNSTANATSALEFVYDGTAMRLMVDPGEAIGGGPYTVTTNGTAVTTGVTQAQPGVTITGMTTTSTCVCSPQTLPATWQTGIQLMCVPTTNTATCQESNPTAGTITPAAITLNIKAFY